MTQTPHNYTHAELLQKILQLQQQKKQQEQTIKMQFQDLTTALNPVALVKESILNLVAEKEVQQGVAKVGINVVANFVIEKILGRNNSIKGYISSLLVEKMSTPFLSKLTEKFIK